MLCAAARLSTSRTTVSNGTRNGSLAWTASKPSRTGPGPSRWSTSGVASAEKAACAAYKACVRRPTGERSTIPTSCRYASATPQRLDEVSPPRGPGGEQHPVDHVDERDDAGRDVPHVHHAVVGEHRRVSTGVLEERGVLHEHLERRLHLDGPPEGLLERGPHGARKVVVQACPATHLAHSGRLPVPTMGRNERAGPRSRAGSSAQHDTVSHNLHWWARTPDASTGSSTTRGMPPSSSNARRGRGLVPTTSTAVRRPTTSTWPTPTGAGPPSRSPPMPARESGGRTRSSAGTGTPGRTPGPGGGPSTSRSPPTSCGCGRPTGGPSRPASHTG